MTLPRFTFGFLVWLLVFTAGATDSMAAQDRDLSSSPQFVSVGVPPNLMFTTDDSGSMTFDYMPANPLSRQFSNDTAYLFPDVPSATYESSVYTNRTIPTFDEDDLVNAYYRSARNNKIYYDPAITYEPWYEYDGTQMADADPTAAEWNPKSTTDLGTYDLTSEKDDVDAHWSFLGSDDISGYPVDVDCKDDDYEDGDTNGDNGCDDTEETFWPMVYWIYDDSGDDDVYNIDNYTRVEIRGSDLYIDGSNASLSELNNLISGDRTADSIEAEKKNFANWFQYYRSRVLAARAGIGKSFVDLDDNVRVGFARINRVDGGSSNLDGVRPFDSDGRERFYDLLYTFPARGGTPLRKAAKNVGEYFKSTGNKGPWSESPGIEDDDEGTHLSCRQSYHILLSDGYWGGGSPSVGNSDNTSGSAISKPSGASYTYSPTSPFKDSYSNTLADVAMEYWKTDLRSDLPNRVPTNNIDSAFWQHLTTFGVGFGVETDSVSPDDAFDAISSGDDITWPDTDDDGQNDPGKIDDLLHFAVNGRGGFFSAADPARFAAELANVLKEIVARSDATTSVALASPRLVSGFLNYRAEFDSENWTGDVAGLEPLSGKVKHTASDNLAGMSVSERNIITFDPVNGSGVPFKSGESGNVDTRVMADADASWAAGDLIDYLRGSDALEGGQFRDRTSRLGDIVNSRVVFSGGGNEGWSGVNSDYLDYVGKDKNDSRDCDEVSGTCEYDREDTIFVGANDGMLHAFDARTLEEFFAYVPSTLHHKLHRLAEPGYSHEFYVDGQTAVGDAYIDGSWGTYLVGTLGAGGRGVFALDVTDPKNFKKEDVLWELSAEDLGDGGNPELGHTFSDPVITRLEDGTWVAIFGNGYNSDSGQARLFVVDLKEGDVLKTLALGDVPADADPANGLSGVESWRDPATGSFVKRIYAGDLEGTMWRVDFDSSEPSTASGMGNGLFTDPDGQAITATPTLGNHPSGGVMVYFGTGKFFEVGDKNDVSLQTAYAIRDQNAEVDSSELAENTLSSPVIIDGISTREVVATGPGTGGWSIDLTVGGTKKGERVLIKPQLKFGKLIFASYEPVDDACTPGGAQRTFLVDAISGGGNSYEIGFGAPMAPPVAIKPPQTTPTPPSDVEDPGLYDPDNPSPDFPDPPGADGSDDRAEWCSRTGIPPLSEGDDFLAFGVLCEGRQTWREAR